MLDVLNSLHNSISTHFECGIRKMVQFENKETSDISLNIHNLQHDCFKNKICIQIQNRNQNQNQIKSINLLKIKKKFKKEEEQQQHLTDGAANFEGNSSGLELRSLRLLIPLCVSFLRLNLLLSSRHLFVSLCLRSQIQRLIPNII